MSVSNCCLSWLRSGTIEVLSQNARKIFQLAILSNDLFALVIAVRHSPPCVKGKEEIRVQCDDKNTQLCDTPSVYVVASSSSLAHREGLRHASSRVNHYDPGFNYTIYNIITISNSSSSNDNSRSSNNNNGNNMIVVIVVSYEKREKKIRKT